MFDLDSLGVAAPFALETALIDTRLCTRHDTRKHHLRSALLTWWLPLLLQAGAQRSQPPTPGTRAAVGDVISLHQRGFRVWSELTTFKSRPLRFSKPATRGRNNEAAIILRLCRWLARSWDGLRALALVALIDRYLWQIGYLGNDAK
jgi:hypothetical protein